MLFLDYDNKILNDLEGNPNIRFYKGEGKQLNFSVEPYSRQITLDYAKKQIEKLMQISDALLETTPQYESIAIFANGYNIDGLSETNNQLIASGNSRIYCNATGESKFLEW